MPLTRHYLPQTRPALHSAAELLLRQPNLARAIVAVPAARAARRLADLLAWFHEQGEAPEPLTLPRIVTTGALPELLMRPPALSIATAGEALAARVGALRGVGADTLRCVFPNLPNEGDTAGWLRLARELEALDSELSGERVGVEAVADYCDAHAPRGESDRWRALAQVNLLARERLRAAGKLHRSDAREAALQNGADGLQRGQTVFLVAAVDLPTLAADMLRVAAPHSHIAALIFAPESNAEGFDDLGRLTPNYWPARTPKIDEAQLRIVGAPREQAYAALEACRRLTDLPNDQITVALGDPALGASVERTLTAGQRPARREITSRLASTGPVTLLQALADFADDHSSAAWAALVRHPDIAAYLGHLWNSPKDAARLPEISDTLRILSLPSAAAAPAPTRVLNKEDKSGLQAKAVAATLALLSEASGGNPRASQPLAAWSAPLLNLLTQLYENREFAPESLADTAPVQALQSLGRNLREIADLPEPLSDELGTLTLPQALRWLTAQVAAEPVFTQAEDDAIPITGWLDTLLDDAPALILAGFNEGLIPETLHGDGLLPESTRVALNLPSNQRRLSRDAYTLAALLASSDVTLIAGRISPTGEPLAPSRLLFTGAENEGSAAQTALRFYSPDQREPSPALPAVITADSDTLAALPKPVPPDESITRLPITAFRDYLACPYRFYLKHVLKLAAVNDARIEIESDLFGTLAHATLAAFGRWVIDERDGATPPIPEMRAFLTEALDKAARARLAPSALPVAAVQIERLRKRLLNGFVIAQSQLADEGWMILYAEQNLEHGLIIDGQPFTAHGRVDRIDYHPETSAARIIDYKTADTPKTPRQTHCPQGEWIDLQLPVYQQIAASLDEALTPETIECGYFNLPPTRRRNRLRARRLANQNHHPPPDPNQLIAQIIQGIRASVFWPPSETIPAYDDGLAALCLDKVLSRAEIIRRDSGKPRCLDNQAKRRVPLRPGGPFLRRAPALCSSEDKIDALWRTYPGSRLPSLKGRNCIQRQCGNNRTRLNGHSI